MLALIVFSPPLVFSDSLLEVLALLSLLSLAVGACRKVNCHEPWCWRIGRHPVDGTPYIACHKHHPGLRGSKVQRGHIDAAHTAVTSRT
jgi:hypothetical protein